LGGELIFGQSAVGLFATETEPASRAAPRLAARGRLRLAGLADQRRACLFQKPFRRWFFVLEADRHGPTAQQAMWNGEYLTSIFLSLRCSLYMSHRFKLLVLLAPLRAPSLSLVLSGAPANCM
jgi:hypothetical protein